MGVNVADAHVRSPSLDACPRQLSISWAQVQHQLGIEGVQELLHQLKRWREVANRLGQIFGSVVDFWLILSTFCAPAHRDQVALAIQILFLRPLHAPFISELRKGHALNEVTC